MSRALYNSRSLTETAAELSLDSVPHRLPAQRRWVFDGPALLLLLVLAAVFYWPRGDILKSRYVYYADMYERSGHVWNHDYNQKFQRHIWEEISPFTTLAARGLMLAWGPQPRAVIWSLNVAILLVAVPATYLLLRSWFSPGVALGVSVFGLFGRSLLGLSRGLGLVQIHLLLPASLLVLLCIPVLYRRSRLLPVLAIALCVALVYLLGCHETFSGLAVLAGGMVVLCGRWVWSCIARRQMLIPSFWLAGSVAAGMVIGVLCMATIWATNPSIGRRPGLGELATYEYFRSRIADDVSLETNSRRLPRAKILAGTFLEGRYLTPIGRHHENTFLYPGAGFNGIIPLFMLPGLVIGLGVLIHRSWLLLGGKQPRMPSIHKGMVVWLWLLLGLFLAAAVSSSDPKPTRYTYSVYAIYVLTFLGYEWLIGLLRTGVTSGANPARRWITSGAVLLVVVLAGVQIRKNLKDLGTYLSHYRGQQVVTRLRPEVNSSLEHPDPDRLTVVLFPARRAWRHPAVGMMAEFESDANLRVCYGQPEDDQFPPEAKVLRVRP